MLGDYRQARNVLLLLLQRQRFCTPVNSPAADAPQLPRDEEEEERVATAAAQCTSVGNEVPRRRELNLASTARMLPRRSGVDTEQFDLRRMC